MNLPRFALYTALAVVTYLMLLQWQEDYPQEIEQAGIAATNAQDMPALPTAAPALSAQDDPVMPTVTTDSGVDAAITSNTDVPALPGAETAAQTIATPQTFVSIKTDTLELQVDTVGGDIVYLALPQYLKSLDENAEPFVILSSAPGRQYVAPSGLIGPNGVDADGRARYSVSQSEFVLGDQDASLTVDLVTTTTDGVEVTKRFAFTRDSYVVDVSYLIENRSGTDFRANPFAQIKRDNFDDPSDAGGFGRTYLGFVSTTLDDPYYEVQFDDIDDDGAATQQTLGGWMAFSQHYFISAWIPDENATNNFTTRKNAAGQYFGEFTGSALTVPAGSSGEYHSRFYAGPKDQYKLAEISDNLDLTIDYSFLWFLAAPIYWLLTRINSFINNFGFSIILLTVTVKALFYKLSETQYRSMAGMRRVMPKMQQLKESYGDDRMKMQQATMELYKKEKINPFGGCLPMLVQMPVFIALYWVLLESVELRHAPFIFWLTDLSVRDPFFILPLLMGGTMFLQTSLSPAPADPMQARVMKLMPIMMTGIFLWFPAGLVLYWFTNAALGIAQQWYITRKIEAQYAASKA
jgi:YidC/Oxa1 family membrane protein insertase